MLVKPIRKDVVSGLSYPKNELIRLVKVGKGVAIDHDDSLKGRGAYVKYEKGLSVEKLIKGLSRSFKRGISNEEAAKILKEIEDERR